MVDDGAGPPTIAQLVTFLKQDAISTYFTIHPNELSSPSFSPPSAWLPWWNWASSEDANGEPLWMLLWRYYTAPPYERAAQDFKAIPMSVRVMVDAARQLRLSRISRVEEKGKHNGNTNGMSPKKMHEVERMTDFVSEMLSGLSVDGLKRIQHVVDVGAGQVSAILTTYYLLRACEDSIAYLSRALRDQLRLSVLALDCSDVQTRGAAKKEQKKGHKSQDSEAVTSEGTLVYKTVNITSETLVRATTEWLERVTTSEGSGRNAEVPVLLVALHACGSLTLDILRAIIKQYRAATSAMDAWTPRGAVIVGCCYNMLHAEDRVLRTDASDGLILSANHLQLAAQTPDQWGTSTSKMSETKLAIRKVAWRALLEGLLAQRAQTIGKPPSALSDKKRLGRLNDSVYTNWDTFLVTAQQRLDASFVGLGTTERDSVLESRISMFHVLRCLLGPVVESFILLDRLEWLRNELHDTDLRVDLVNLFDQASGSGRNVAIVVKPAHSDCEE
ncbi:hypothetical protein BXZ70DRAFT_1002943 [Cristinia sonorae]|uniref:Methyltransferase domain-containing protein n=1 Tax=Cristinia sonorae TaxID=1940300 RepID=A0A8K0UE92_9AGAR|nr:hypothetical protein BXZ70DRAFT_1002943 [Cristinia sonorae]